MDLTAQVLSFYVGCGCHCGRYEQLAQIILLKKSIHIYQIFFFQTNLYFICTCLYIHLFEVKVRQFYQISLNFTSKKDNVKLIMRL